MEVLEETCERMLQYKVHKEKSDISRFAKEESSTMKALHELRNKGVKVCSFSVRLKLRLCNIDYRIFGILGFILKTLSLNKMQSTNLNFASL